MAAIVQRLPTAAPELPVAISSRSFATASIKQQQRALQTLVLIRAIEQRPVALSPTAFIKELASAIKAKVAGAHIMAAVAAGAKASVATLQRDWTSYRAHGIDGLVCNHNGRPLEALGCETRMFALYLKPTQPSAGTVAYWLEKEGFENVSAGKIRRRLQRAPSHLSETSPKRKGQHFYDQNIRPYQLLDWSNLPVGVMYVGDGHRCDAYVAHPSTGEPIRPELTVWIDRRSQYIVGAWLAYDENGRESIFGLAEAIYRYRSVPGFIYVDPGPGFDNNDMMGEHGFCARFEIEPIVTRAGNARAKGIIEGLFGNRYKERFDKRWDTYCGHDRSDDFLSRLKTKIKRSQVRLPTWDEYRQAVIAYIAEYNAHPTKALGAAPADLWAELIPNDPVLPPEMMVRPRDVRIVNHWWVRHDNRRYRLAGDYGKSLESRQVLIEWDWRSDLVVWIYDLDGRFLCNAELVERRHGMSESRIADAERRRMEGRIKRKERDIESIKAQAHGPITAEVALRGLEHFDALELPAPDKEIEGLQPLDLHDTDY